MEVILLGANNPKLVGWVASSAARAGFKVEITGEVVPCNDEGCGCTGTLLARIEITKPVNVEVRAVKKAWAEKMEAVKKAAKA